MNVHESEKIAGMLSELGYKNCNEMTEADIVVFNTCCIRENAENHAFGNIGMLKKLKSQRRDLIIAVGGCLPQQIGKAGDLHEKFPYVDIIFGTHNLHKLKEYVQLKEKQKKSVISIEEDSGFICEDEKPLRTSYPNAWVNITYGCNNFCSYCIVPYVRGRERSRKSENIIAEAEELVAKGYKEITLLGQNVNSYDGGEGYKFSNLLYDVNRIEGIERIRFVSPHPKDFTDDVIEAIAKCDKICKIIHLPLQSGSSKMLKVMNRKYTKEQYLELAEKMQERIPNVVFSTDIIVGFAGETDEDFEDTLDVVRRIKFEQVYMFIYSRRVGTPGDKMENQVPEEIKHKRFDRLKELVESQIAENNQKYIGTHQKVLVEGTSKNNPNMLTGRTESNKVVIFDGTKDLIDKIIDLKIVSEHMWYLKGEIEM